MLAGHVVQEASYKPLASFLLPGRRCDVNWTVGKSHVERDDEAGGRSYRHRFLGAGPVLVSL